MLIPILIQRLFVVGFLVFSTLFGVGLGASGVPERGASVPAEASLTVPTVALSAPEHPAPTAPPAPDEATTTTPPTVDPLPDAEPAKLVVAGNIELPSGTYSGSFELTNTGGQPAEWIWFGSPLMTVTSPGGTLEPGETALVGFEVDASQLDPGTTPILNCIAYDGGAVDLWVTVTKPGSPPTIPHVFTG